MNVSKLFKGATILTTREAAWCI